MADRYNNVDNLGAQAEEQAKHKLEQTQENSIKTLEGLSKVQEKNGKNFWLGMEVPAELAGTLEYVTSIAPTIVSDFLRDGVYKNSSYIFQKLSSNPEFGHKAGLAATATMSGLLIGLQPISTAVRGVRERVKERKDIRTAMSAVIDSDPDGYKNNEVIKTAMERANKVMVTGFKQAAAEFPTVLVNGLYAIGSHKELAAKKTGDFLKKQKVADVSASDGASAAKVHMAQTDELKKKRSEFFAEYKAAGKESEADKAWETHELKKKQEDEHRQRNYRDHHDERNSNNNPSNPNDMKKLLALNVAGGANVFIKQLVNKSAKEGDKPCAYQLILSLQEKINNGNISKGSNITDQIVEIFQQNEKDRGRSGVGPALMEKLEPLAERIGEVVASGELDPLALVSFVGDGKVVNKRRFIKTEQLEELIDNQRKLFGSHEKTPLDEMLADFQSPKMIMAAIVEALQTLKGRDKAIFASFFSDEVLLHAGVKKKEIPALRIEGNDGFLEVVKTKTMEFAKNPPEELKKLGRSETEIEGIMSLNALIVAGNEKEVKSVIGRGDGVVAAVRNAMLQKQVESKEDGKTYWTKIIKQKPPVIAVEKQPDMSAVERVATGREGGASLGGVA